jgi:hypothetical protein
MYHISLIKLPALRQLVGRILFVTTCLSIVVSLKFKTRAVVRAVGGLLISKLKALGGEEDLHL